MTWHRLFRPGFRPWPQLAQRLLSALLAAAAGQDVWELLAHQGVARLPPATPPHRLPHGPGAGGRERPHAAAADVLCARWQLPQPTPVGQAPVNAGGGGEGAVVTGGVAVGAGGGEQAGGSGGGAARKRPGDEEGREAAGGLQDAKRARHVGVAGREQPAAEVRETKSSDSGSSSSSSESSSEEDGQQEAQEQSEGRELRSPGAVAQQHAQSAAPGAAPPGPRAGELATRDHVARTAEERVRLLHSATSRLPRRAAQRHDTSQSGRGTLSLEACTAVALLRL